MFSLEYVLSHIERNNQSKPNDRRVLADSYHSASWVDEYYSELWAGAVKWEPYTYWRYKSRKGNFININKEGLRLTTQNNDGITSNQIKRIFMFGGSTLFGTGARDSHTIPSLFSSELHKKGVYVEVFNYGQSGYVSTQEVFDLIKELQRGNIPDAVIFYDGVNDVYSAYQNQQPGLPQNEANRRKEFNLSKNLPAAYDNFIYNLAKSSRLASFLARLLNMKNKNTSYESVAQPNLAYGTAETYFHNIRVVNALSLEYNFEAVFYWQPTIFNKSKLTKYEKLEYARELSVKSLFDEVYRIVSKKNHTDGFYDLSNLFYNTNPPVFIDFCHISEDGNLIVAKEMAINYIESLSNKN